MNQTALLCSLYPRIEKPFFDDLYIFSRTNCCTCNSMFDWLHPSHRGSPAARTPARPNYWRKLKAREFKSAAPPHAAARPHIFENKLASAFVRWKTHFHLLPEGVTRRLLVWCRCRPGDHQMEAREKERLRKNGWEREDEGRKGRGREKLK